MATNCLPSSEHVIGDEATCPPRYLIHSSFPSEASSAKKWPSRLPETRTLEAVVRRPLSLTSAILYSQTRFPVAGSRARTAPYPASGPHFRISLLTTAGRSAFTDPPENHLPGSYFWSQLW